MPASERSNIWKTTVYSVLLILAIWPLCHGRQVYHVTPNEETNCHNATAPCHTLDYYAKELNEDSHYFPQETVLYFHPGIHNLAGNISIASLAELVLHGSDTASSSRMVPVEIVCTSKGEAGFLLQHVNNLVIANLTFTSCGLMYRKTSAAIHIRFVTNLTISHTVVQNSTGYGVAAVIDEPGNIVVTNSQFIYNGWHTDQTGGHMKIFNSFVKSCSDRSGINLSIRSSMFLYENTSTIYPPGVFIVLEYPCYPFNIHIGDSIFIGNGEYHNHSDILLEDPHLQKLSTQCSPVTYFVSSQKNFEEIFLIPYTANQLPNIDDARLGVSLLPCPLGFNLSTATERCECASPLDELNFNCSIASQTIHRSSAVWIGYYHFNSDDESSNNTVTPGGVILHMHCPLDYCKTEDTELNLEDPSEQCAFNHSGILCGGCQSGLSLALGTSRCLPCSNAYVALVFAFAVAGVALVALLTVCNLTVSQGTLSGLIFYANIIHINHPIFFPGDDVNVLTVFIAWLNLDLGIETCFHNGMSMYEKAWLQFIFPAYVLLVSLVIMILSHYSTIATRVFGRHAVKVLATLFLLAYAKLLRSIITVLSYTSMIYPDHSLRFLWLYDGNIMYFHDKHIPLGLVAVMAFLLVIVPYTLTLIFGQCLQRRAYHRIVNRLKPFLDAYTGPYKDKYRFLPDILLLARLFFSSSLHSMCKVHQL